MNRIATAGMVSLLLAGHSLISPSFAETATTTTKVTTVATPGADAMFLSKMPGDSASISTYYNRIVYNNAGNSIGDVNDLLLGADGKIAAAVIGVGGFLGMGEKEVAVPFDTLKVVRKDNSWHLAMDTTKEALMAAPSYETTGERVRLAPPASTKLPASGSDATTPATQPVQ
jgi:sporulation protein YlmC with PRC-barrel domain